MANQEHLEILKQGVEVWNQWRKEHPTVHADLVGADLSKYNLSGANLGRANLSGALLFETNLCEADLKGTYLSTANFYRTDLSRTRFIEADLWWANFNEANLNEAHLGGAYMAMTTFGNVDLSVVKGLETVIHDGPSIIGINTIIRSHGNIPETFLRSAGVPPSIIEAIPSLVGSLKPIDFYSCFISYSSKNQGFTERLYADLQAKGVRCWFASEDLKIGDKFWHRIDESIRTYDKLLIVLSEYSVQSDWVEREVMAALEKEKQRKIVLFPITLDDAVKDCTAPWAADIRRSRRIGDFRRWKNHDDYQKAFDRLLRDLKAAS